VVIEELLEGRRANGRHALDEDALHTPIFAALSRGGWRRRQESAGVSGAVASVEDFRRDPLTAPLPIQPVAAPEWQAAEVTGGVIVDMAAGEARRRGSAVHRTRAAREWTASRDAARDRARDGAAGRRDGAGRDRSRTPRHVLAVGHEWPGLDALADTGRHHLRAVASW
jgi:hypothetical protein